MRIAKVKRLISDRRLTDRLLTALNHWAPGAMGRINQRTPIETGRLRSTAEVRVTAGESGIQTTFYWDRGLYTPEGYARQLEYSTDKSPRTPGTEIPWARPGVAREAQGKELEEAIGRALK